MPMECILCGKELDGDSQICGECAIKAFEKDPLWHCRDFLLGDSVPDVLRSRSTMVLSLGHDRESFIDDRPVFEDIAVPEHPLKDDVERIFWKINTHLNHIGVPLYMEDTWDMELTVQDLENISHMLGTAMKLHEMIGSADEEALSRIASLYYHGGRCLRYLRGMSAEGRKSLEQALNERMNIYLSAGENIMPHRGHIFINQAHLHILSGNYRDALETYRMVPEYDSNARALTGMGRAYEGLEMPESADDAYTNALRVDSKWVPAWKGKASVALESKRWGAALQFISQAINLRPDRADLHILKGDIFSEQGLTTEADRAYQKATSLRWGEDAWLRRAELMYKAGRWGAALQFVERYLFYFPGDEEGLVWRERIKSAVDERAPSF